MSMQMRQWAAVLAMVGAGCADDDRVDCSLTDTPGLPAAKACVHQVPNGASLEELPDGTTVVRVAGKEVDRFEACPCPAPELPGDDIESSPEMCSLEDAFYKGISQVDYDYQPRVASSLAALANIIATGRVEDVYGAQVDQFTSTRLTLRIEAVHKGAAAPSDRIDVDIARAPVVSEADLRTAARSIPSAQVTVFLSAQPSTTSLAPASRPVYALASPQGIVVATSSCLVQPLTESPLFDASVMNEATLQAALEKLSEKP